MNPFLEKLLVIVTVGLLLWTREGVAAAGPKERAPIPVGDVRNATIYYSVVFYYTPTPKAEPLETARMLTAQAFPKMPLVNTGQTMEAPYLHFEEEQAPLTNYPVPPASYFKYAGRGLTPENIAAIRKTDRATRLVLVAPRELAWTAGRSFTQLALDYAKATDAFIWDSATRECFSPASWQTNRLDSWPPNSIPDIRRQITIHLYQASDDEPYLRAITLGMEKFALPDVVIERLIRSDNRPGGNLINAFCQSLAENPVITNGAAFPFRLQGIKTETVRTNLAALTLTGAKQAATLALLRGKPQAGDPENALIEISFRHGKGKTDDERRQDIISEFWGSEDSITAVKHTDEILAASRRALRQLKEYQPRFERGLKPGEQLMVKAPFTRDDEGNEWMWVEVTRWPPGKSLEGILQNDPFYIKKLKAGAKVQVKVEEIFDYMFFRADGTSEGNETGRLMEKQGGQSETK